MPTTSSCNLVGIPGISPFFSNTQHLHIELMRFEFCCWKTPNFIEAELWPPKSPDVNRVNCKIWAAVSLDKPKQRLTDVWHGLQQHVIDATQEDILNKFCKVDTYNKRNARNSIMTVFPSVLWHCWLGDRKGIRPVKNWMLVCWWWWFDWSFAWLTAPLVQLSPPPPSPFASINTS